MMRFLLLARLIMIVSTVTAGCSNPNPAESERPPAGFDAILARIEREAKAKSKAETSIQVEAPTDMTEGRRIVKARRATPTAVTEYAMTFERTGERWVCREATAKEKEASGGTSENSIGGKEIEIENLMRWLGW